MKDLNTAAPGGELLGYTSREIPASYAIIAEGDRMAPRFTAGETLYVNPSLPAKSDSDVLVIMPDDTACVRRLVRRRGVMIELRQFNPPKKITLRADKVKAMHLIIGHTIAMTGE